VPAIVGVVENGWTAVWRDTLQQKASAGWMTGGAHGYEPGYRDMHALFIAAGPGLRRGFVAPAIQNIHLYEFMCRILGLRPAANDGDPSRTATYFDPQGRA
jgi:hypothetical protein